MIDPKAVAELKRLGEVEHPIVPMYGLRGEAIGREEREAIMELRRRELEEPIRYFKPNEGSQEVFFSMLNEKREVAFFAGNKSGKTHCGAKYVVQAALGKDAANYGMDVLFDEPIDIVS